MPKTDQGVSPDRYMVIPRCLIFITRGSAVLLLKGSPNKRLWANRYNGIGGHVEQGEDVYAAARRELFEETGLQVDEMKLCGNIMVDAGEKIGITIFVFRGDYAGGTLVPSEEGSLEWIESDGLSSLPLVEDLRMILPRVLAMQPCDPPFTALTTYDDNDQMVVNIR